MPMEDLADEGRTRRAIRRGEVPKTVINRGSPNGETQPMEIG